MVLLQISRSRIAINIDQSLRHNHELSIDSDVSTGVSPSNTQFHKLCGKISHNKNTFLDTSRPITYQLFSYQNNDVIIILNLLRAVLLTST